MSHDLAFVGGIGSSPAAVAVTSADLDGNGIKDIVVALADADALSVLLGRCDGSYDPPIVTPVGPSPRAVALGDVDGDAIPDACGPRFIRGDVDGSGAVQLGDAIGVLGFLFGGTPMACPSAADFDDDGTVLLGDAVQSLGYLFGGGPRPRCRSPVAVSRRGDRRGLSRGSLPLIERPRAPSLGADEPCSPTR